MRAMVLNNYTTHPTEGKPVTLDPPAAGRLGDINVPTLVIVGNFDTSDTQAIADVFARHIPGARKVVMEGTAHVPSMEKPDEFNRIVLEFLGSLPERS
jgi:2-hydroxy-6-oxonona-2,4-dienedioate hydrolase